ncbi:MAG: LysM peptidoglycan-binding domain-containing protein [Chloroflexi bacterium]|nr:LysM peptidoglycan-binding domain-containing protein [Chloroflexota bacterium]
MPTTRGGLEPAVIINKNTGERVPCMFNPYEYTITKQNTYEQASTKGLNIPRVRFRQGGAQTLTLRLLFDTYGQGEDVRTYTAPLWRMMMVDEDRADQRTGKSEPPHCIFQWGRFEFEAVITKMDEKFTLFLKDGTPVRTVVNITLQQVIDEEAHAKQNPTSGGGTAPRTRIVYAGDRLDLIAWEEYGDATRWRRIAEANGITNPLRLRPGQILMIPPLE